MTAILKYPGGKWRIAEDIISYFPKHDVYLEPFFGSGAVFFRKEKSKIETAGKQAEQSLSGGQRTECNGVRGDVSDAVRVLSNPLGFGRTSGEHEDRELLKTLGEPSEWQSCGADSAFRSNIGKWWSTEPRLGRVAHGVPHRVDRLTALGNAVVPQQVYSILAILAEILKQTKKEVTL